MPTESLAKEIGPRDKMEYDVVIVGAGPCGLATAIRLKQHAVPHNRELNACVLENGSEPGAQILSGAIMDPLAITELLPTRNEMGVPLKQEVTSDEFLLLSETGARTAPTSSCPTASAITGTSSSAWVAWCDGSASGPEALIVEISPPSWASS